MADLILYCQRREIPFPSIVEIARSWRYAPSVVERALWDAAAIGVKIRKIGYFEWNAARAKMAKLQAMLDSGMEWADVEERTGIGLHTFRKWRQAFGVTKGRKRYPPEVKGKVKELWTTTNLTLKEIGGELDIKGGSIATIVRMLGLFPREKHRVSLGD